MFLTDDPAAIALLAIAATIGTVAALRSVAGAIDRWWNGGGDDEDDEPPDDWPQSQSHVAA